MQPIWVSSRPQGAWGGDVHTKSKENVCGVFRSRSNPGLGKKRGGEILLAAAGRRRFTHIIDRD